MFKKINRFKRSEYVRNVFIVTTGTTISQLLPLFAAPVLTRIYSPVEYGILGLYLSITGIISIFATLKFSQAILIVKDDGDADIITSMTFWIALIVTGLTAVLFLLSGQLIAQLLNVSELGLWFYFAPLTIFFNAVIEIFLIYANRHKSYKTLNYSRVGSVIIQLSISITLGVLYGGEMGLFAGLLISQFLNVLYLILFSGKKTARLLLKKVQLKEYRRVAQKFRNFPIFALPSEMINYFSNQLPVLMIGLYSPQPVANVGAFGMSMRLLGLPSQLISASISEVFRQRATQDYNTTGDCRNIFLKTFKVLFLISFVPFLLIGIFSPVAFSFILGKEWELAGEMSQLLCFMFFMRFSISPLSYVVYIRNKQYLTLAIDAYLFISNFVIFYLCLVEFKFSVLNTLAVFSLNYGLLYLVTYWVSYHLTVNKKVLYDKNV